MNKRLFFTNEAITEQERQKLRDLDERQERERQELYDKIPTKAKVLFMDAPFAPFEDRILVFPDPVEERTTGGIIVPDSVIEKAKPLIGTVVRVGPGKDGKWRFKEIDFSTNKFEEHSIAPLTEGDRIYYGNYAGTEIVIGGIKYLIMRFADCFGLAI
jgi:chaperonin GroES